MKFYNVRNHTPKFSPTITIHMEIVTHYTRYYNSCNPNCETIYHKIQKIKLQLQHLKI